MTKGSNFWVIGGEFGSMNFHKLVEGSAQVQGPFKTRQEAEDAWRRSRKRTATRPAYASPSWKSPPASRRKACCRTDKLRRRRPRTRAAPSGTPDGAVLLFAKGRGGGGGQFKAVSHWEQTAFARERGY